MKKILYAASVPAHLKNFHVPYITALAEAGDRVWTLCSGKCELPGVSQSVDLPLKKSLWAPGNFLSAVRLAGLLKRERFDLICVHTALAAFFVRLAVLLAGKENAQVVNVVHGYLFDEKTNPLKRGLMLSAEMLLRRVTDRVAVMNHCDLEIAEKHRLGAEVVFIPGMGVDFHRFSLGNRAAFRQELRLGGGDLLLLFPAEFSARKNQEFLIKALAALPDNIYLALPGEGKQLDFCRKLASDAGVAGRVYFPGQVGDLSGWYAAADICVSASRYEGLPFNIMEGMYAGKPVVASRIKGHTDLIAEGAGGFLFGWNDREEFCDCIRTLTADPELRRIMGEKNRASVQAYEIGRVFPQVLAAVAMQSTASAAEETEFSAEKGSFSARES